MPQRQVVAGGSSPTAARQGPVTHAAAAHAAATLVMCRRAAGGAPVTHMACVGNLPATGWNTTNLRHGSLAWCWRLTRSHSGRTSPGYRLD